MLNELFELDSARRESQISADSWHKHYSPCPKYATFLLLVDAAGNVMDIEPVGDPERRSCLRKWEVANGISFPAFNMLPVFHAATEQARREISELKKWLKAGNSADQTKLRDRIGQVCLLCDELESDSEARRINQCLQSHPEKLRRVLGPIPAELQSLGDLIGRAQQLDVNRLRDSVRQISILKITDSPSSIREWLDTLLVSSAPRKKSIKKVSVVLELADRSHYAYPANHPKAQAWINSRLLAQEAASADRGAPDTSNSDAFGFPSPDRPKKFPDANLPRLGSVKLRAMSSESPCQRRYGRSDAESFPAGPQVRQAMKDSLEWLANPNRRGKTWEDVSEACGHNAALLFAYPTMMPPDPPELAGLFAAEVSSPGNEARFEAAAASVTPALQGIAREHPEAEVRVFVLAKADKARTKVALNKTYTSHRLISSAQAWQDACQNLPYIRLNLGTDASPDWRTPRVPFPSEVAECLNVAWLQAGGRADAVHNSGIGEGVSLLLDTGPRSERLVRKMLCDLLSTASPLLLALGHADHRRDGRLQVPPRYSKHANLVPAVLGLLLAKLGFLKGDYMHSAPFLVGRMLALADTLHKEYCRSVRKGEIPPQMIGNALMKAALDNPERGLAHLTERLLVYQAWANKSQGDEYRLVKWTLGQLGQVSTELAKFTLPVRATESDKAQMLLGYLARPDSETTGESEAQNANPTEEVPNA
jgi:hypothetical protein